MSPGYRWRTYLEAPAHRDGLLDSTLVQQDYFRQPLTDQLKDVYVGRRGLVLVPIAERYYTEKSGAVLEGNLHIRGGVLT
jgi:hypothetical protein